MNKPTIVAVIVGIIVVVGAVAYVQFSAEPNGQGQQQDLSQIKVTPLGVDKQLDGFPPALVPSDSRVTGNRSIALPDGKVQLAKQLESPKPVDQAFAYYRTLLSDSRNGWTVTYIKDDAKDPANKTIIAKNGVGVVTINVGVGVRTTGSDVAVSFVTGKK